MVATYLVAILAILFAAVSAITWIYAVTHFDSHQIASEPERAALDRQPANSVRVPI